MSRKEPLQQRIILYLARTEPQTINETAKRISKDYKSSWTAFNKLSKKGLVKKVKKKYYRGNQYPYFWLTEVGILQAIDQGADPEHLLDQTCKIYPQNKNLQFFIQSVSVFGEEIADEFGGDILGNPDEVETSIIGLISTELMNLAIHTLEIREPYRQEQMTRFKVLLNRYPELHAHLISQLEQYAEEFKRLANLLR